MGVIAGGEASGAGVDSLTGSGLVFGAAWAGGVMEAGGKEVVEAVGGAGGVGAFSGMVGVGVTEDSGEVVTSGSAIGGLTEGLGCEEAGSRGGVGSAGGVGVLGCSFSRVVEGEERGAARRLLKEVAADVENTGLVTDRAAGSGGLNAALDKSVKVESASPNAASASFPCWRADPKLNSAAPVPNPSAPPLSGCPKLNVAAEGFSSSPWPTRRPEKLPRVSPPTTLGAWGSTLRVGVMEVGLTGSPDMLERGVGEPLAPRAGEVDLGAKEKGSSPAEEPNIIFPVPPPALLKENLLTSFTGKRDMNRRFTN